MQGSCETDEESFNKQVPSHLVSKCNSDLMMMMKKPLFVIKFSCITVLIGDTKTKLIKSNKIIIT